MCEAAPGPRCWSGTQEKLTNLSKKMTAKKAQVVALGEVVDSAIRDGDLSAYDSAKKSFDLASKQYDKMVSEEKLAMMDADGTRKGISQLQLNMATTKSSAKKQEFSNRIKAGELLRFVRKTALEMSRNNVSPLLRAGGSL